MQSELLRNGIAPPTPHIRALMESPTPALITLNLKPGGWDEGLGFRADGLGGATVLTFWFRVTGFEIWKTSPDPKPQTLKS